MPPRPHAMLLAKISALRAREAEEAAAAAAETAPRPKPKKKRRQRRRESEAKNEVALHGWRKVRIAGLKEAARRRRAQDVEVQDAPDGPIRRFRGHVGPVLCASVTPDGKMLVTGGKDGDVRVWRMPADDDATYEDGDRHCLLVLSGHTASVCAVCVDDTGARIFSAGADNHVRIWNVVAGTAENGEPNCARSKSMSHAADDLRARDLDADDAAKAQSMSRGRKAYSRTFSATPQVLSLAVSRDTKRVFAGGTDRDLKVWDAEKGTLRVALQGHDGPVGALARFHGDAGSASTRVLTGSGDGTVRAWDLARSKCEAVMEGHAGAVLALAVARDDQRAYSVGAEGDVVGWRVGWTENVPDSFRGYAFFKIRGAHRGKTVRCVAVTPGSGGADQGTLFTGGEDGVVRAWRAADGTALCALTGHADFVGGVATCAFGKTLCSASHDGSVIAWRVGKLTRREKTQRAAVQGFLDAVKGKGT